MGRSAASPHLRRSWLSLTAGSGTLQASIDVCNFIDPVLPLDVFEFQNVVERPVEMVGEVGYLLAQTIKGVAYDPPSSARSTS